MSVLRNAWKQEEKTHQKKKSTCKIPIFYEVILQTLFETPILFMRIAELFISQQKDRLKSLTEVSYSFD